MGVFHGILRGRQDLTSILIFSMLSNIVAGRSPRFAHVQAPLPANEVVDEPMSGRAAAKKIARAAPAVEDRE
jgi:hypothetical protein